MSDLNAVQRVAEQLIRTHLDPLYGAGTWTFGFDRAKRRAGLCSFEKQHISLSRYLAEKYSDEDNEQTILHEIAHAIAGPRAGHGPRWKRIAYDIGYRGGRTHDGEIAHEHASWLGLCPAGHEHFRFRRPNREMSCGKCARGFSRAHLIVWSNRRP